MDPTEDGNPKKHQNLTDLCFLKVPSGEATWAHWETETAVLKKTGLFFHKLDHYVFFFKIAIQNINPK